jgi:hypothetical protein
MSDAADRMAKTRLAIIEHIHRKEGRHERRDAREAHAEGRQEFAGWEEEHDSRRGPAGWFAHIKRVGGAWWRSHPANMGLELATPMLSNYARRKPVQFLAIAAAVGAVAMVARPWRLISVTGLLVALVKSSQLSGLVMSAMSAADYPKDDQPRR